MIHDSTVRMNAGRRRKAKVAWMAISALLALLDGLSGAFPGASAQTAASMSVGTRLAQNSVFFFLLRE